MIRPYRLSLIKFSAAHAEQKRRKANIERICSMDAGDLEITRDALKILEDLGLKPETPSAFVQIKLNSLLEKVG